MGPQDSGDAAMSESNEHYLAMAHLMVRSFHKNGKGGPLHMRSDLFDLLAADLEGSLVTFHGNPSGFIGKNPGVNELHFNMYDPPVIVKPDPAHHYFQ